MRQIEKKESVNEFIYDCGCGCSSLRFTQWKDEGISFISLIVPAWNASQGFYGGWKNALKIIWNILRGREHYFYEITIEDNETLRKFKEFVSNMREID